MDAFGTARGNTLKRERLGSQAAEKNRYASLRSMAWFHGKQFKSLNRLNMKKSASDLFEQPHGLEPNRSALKKFVQYAREQGYISIEPGVDDLFAAVK